MKRKLLFAALILCGSLSVSLQGLAKEIPVGQDSRELVNGRADESLTYKPYADATYELIYEEVTETSVAIIGYTGTAFKELVIPNEIDGKSVNQVVGHAFEGCSGFTGSLTLPENLVRIGDSAFKGCSGLTGDVVIYGGSKVYDSSKDYDAMLTIGSKAFEGCDSLSGDIYLMGYLSYFEEDAFRQDVSRRGEITIHAPKGFAAEEDAAAYGYSYSEEGFSYKPYENAKYTLPHL